MNRLVIQVIQGNLVLSSICRSKFLQKQYPPKGIKLFIPPAYQVSNGPPLMNVNGTLTVCLSVTYL